MSAPGGGSGHETQRNDARDTNHNGVPVPDVGIVDLLAAEQGATWSYGSRSRIVEDAGSIPVTVRYSRGVEIAAACGQLRSRHEGEQQAAAG